MPAFSWAWTPVLAIGVAAVANAAMIVVSLSAHPDTVAGVRSGSGGSDASVAAGRSFARTGARLSCEPIPGGIRMRLADGDVREVSVACERPANAALDRFAAWPDVSTPLTIALPARGRWSVRVSGRDAQGDRVERLTEVLVP